MDVEVNEMDVEEPSLLESLEEALLAGASVDVVRGILQEAGSLDRHVDFRQLFHILLWAFTGDSFHLDVLKLILEFIPALLEREDTIRGSRMLHVAIRSRKTREMIEFLIEQNPDALREPDAEGYLPLHAACQRQMSLDVVEILLSNYPGAAHTPAIDHFNMLPLHLCLKYNAPTEVTVAVLEEYPDAATRNHLTVLGEIALHVYCGQGRVELDVLRRLVQVYPEGLQAKSYTENYGKLPLHSACSNRNTTLEAVEFLVNEYPDSVRIRRADGMLPLHVAYSKFAPMDVVEFLVEAYPDAVSTPDEQGMLPMHYACSSEMPRGNHLQVLIDNYNGPDESFGGLAVVDSSGRVPLHYATSQGDAETVQLLVDHYPGGIHVSDQYRGQLPLHAACSCSYLNLEQIQCLVGADPRTVIQKDSLDRTPYQLVRQRLRRFHEIEMFLVDLQDIVVNELKHAVVEVANTQLQFPDLVAAQIWSFAKPDLWRPE